MIVLYSVFPCIEQIRIHKLFIIYVCSTESCRNYIYNYIAIIIINEIEHTTIHKYSNLIITAMSK